MQFPYNKTIKLKYLKAEPPYCKIFDFPLVNFTLIMIVSLLSGE